MVAINDPFIELSYMVRKRIEIISDLFLILDCLVRCFCFVLFFLNEINFGYLFNTAVLLSRSTCSNMIPPTAVTKVTSP